VVERRRGAVFAADVRAGRVARRFVTDTIGPVADSDCALCRFAEGDVELERVQVWEDRLWRLTMSISGYTLGFAYLEPKRHIPHITDLDGEEAASLGPTLARVTSALKSAAGAELVYVYVFGGGVPHLHFHLAPHRAGDALSTAIIRGELEFQRLPSGAGKAISREFPELPAADIRAVIDRVRTALNAS
jgi:diadenosine tetraphosphate (Ap4A) HIT family hydrolase